jgi:hypothetical protein
MTYVGEWSARRELSKQEQKTEGARKAGGEENAREWIKL